MAHFSSVQFKHMLTARVKKKNKIKILKKIYILFKQCKHMFNL